MIQAEIKKNEEDYMLLIENCHNEYETIVENSKV